MPTAVWIAAERTVAGPARTSAASVRDRPQRESQIDAGKRIRLGTGDDGQPCGQCVAGRRRIDGDPAGEPVGMASHRRIGVADDIGEQRGRQRTSGPQKMKCGDPGRGGWSGRRGR